MKKLLLLAIVLLVIGFSVRACRNLASTDAAEKAVADFHSALDARRFDAIAGTTTVELHEVGQQNRMLTFLERVHDQLGKSGESKLQNWHVDYHTDRGKFTTLVYDTHYEKGDAVESFIYKEAGEGQLELAGYNIESKALRGD